MQTITITTPPNTTVVLPPGGSIVRPTGGPVTITIRNQAGEAITLGSSGVSEDFTVGPVPPSIAHGDSDQIDLAVREAGTIHFEFEADQETITVNQPFECVHLEDASIRHTRITDEALAWPAIVEESIRPTRITGETVC